MTKEIASTTRFPTNSTSDDTTRQRRALGLGMLRPLAANGWGSIVVVVRHLAGIAGASTRPRATVLTARVTTVVVLALTAAFFTSGATAANAAPHKTLAGAHPADVATGDSNYTPLDPIRALDTRRNLGAAGPVGPGKTIALTVAGAGIPTTGVSAVAINLTVTSPAATGFLLAYPDLGAAPATSSLNFLAGQTVANMAIVEVGSDGKIAIQNRSKGAAQIVGDIEGYFTGDNATTEAPGYFVPLAPVRALDTRTSTGAPGPIPAGASITLVVAGGGVPQTDVAAVAVNLTVVGPKAAGYVTAYPDLTAPPTSSNVNFTKGQTVANFGIVTVGPDGILKITNHSAGSIELVGDISGYFWGDSGWPGPPQGTFTALTPARVLDTRNGTGASGPIPSRGTITLSLAGVGGLPARNTGAVTLNLTVTASTRGGYITAYPSGSAAPDSSSLNFLAGQTVANLAIVAVPANGQITLTNNSAGTVHLIADVSGYFYADYWSTVNVGVTGGAGTVTISPPGTTCRTACSTWYPTGTRVQLTETPDPGMNFNSWSGNCTGQGACSVTAPGGAGASFATEGGLAPGQVGTVATNFFGKTAVCVTNLDVTRAATFHGEDRPPIGAWDGDGSVAPGQTNCDTLNRGWVGYNVLVTNTSTTGSHIAACVLPSGQNSCPG